MKRLGMLVVLAGALALSACGSSNNNSTSTAASGGGSTAAANAKANAKVIKANSANGSKTVTIGSKNFTEEFILG